MNTLQIRSSILAMRRAGIVVSLLALSLTAYAQVERGTITGAVTDSKGATIPDATVRMVEESTSQTVKLQTDSAGEYTASNLTPGAYTVEVEKAASPTTSIKASSFRSYRLRGSTLSSMWGPSLSQCR